MALSINKRQPRVPPSTEDALKDLPTLLLVETLDLSHGDIVGGAIVEFLQFIALTDTPFALQFMDLSHNRLGDAGAIALAHLLQRNASKLPSLTTLDLAVNDIRDTGALALVQAVDASVLSGHLHQLRNVELRDNKLSETGFRSVDAAWREIAMAKHSPWWRIKAPSEASGGSSSSSFADLLSQQVELVKSERVAQIAAVLEPVTMLLKRALWNRVAHEREMLPKRLVLQVFPPLQAEAVSNVPPLVADTSSVLIPRGGRSRSEHRSTVSKILATSPKLQEFMAMVESERITFHQLLCKQAAESDYISTALTQTLGLKTAVKAKTRNWSVSTSVTRWEIENGWSVEVVAGPKPIELESSSTFPPPGVRICASEEGFAIVCELPC